MKEIRVATFPYKIGSFKINDYIVIKPNYINPECVSIGLFTTNSWNRPIIWQHNLNMSDPSLNDKPEDFYVVNIGERCEINSTVEETDVYFLIFGQCQDADISIFYFESSQIEPEPSQIENGTVVLYEKKFNTTTVDSEFTNAKSSSFTSNGFVVDTTAVTFNRYYSISQRKLTLLCKFSDNTIANIFSDTNDTVCKINLSANKISVNTFE